MIYKITICLILAFFIIIGLCYMFDSKREIKQEQFDKTKWKITEDRKYPYRAKMLYDLMANYKLHGLKGDSVVRLLGSPNRTENNHLYYTITQTFFANTSWPLFTKTLVIKLKNDSTVEWRKIHG